MNNYCTNCGKRLEKDDLVCKNCNTPIIDLPYNYDYKSSEAKKNEKSFSIVTGICMLCVLCIAAFFFVNHVARKNKISKMQKEYIEPYLKENYSNLNYSIEYNSSGKCIVSGNCYFDITMGCNGTRTCQNYVYHDKNYCKSYYYSIKSDTKEFILTVVHKNGQYYVVEG